MDTMSGRIYDMADVVGQKLIDGDYGQKLRDGAAEAAEDAAAELRELVGRELTPDEAAATKAVAEGRDIVAVSAQVAQAQKAGQRELERRRRRRNAQKAARKSNR